MNSSRPPSNDSRSEPGQGARALVLVAIFVGCFGGCDAARSFQELGEVVVEQPAMDNLERAQAMQSAIVLLTNDPHRRSIAAGHLVVSLLLILGAPMLFRRRKSGAWWVRNLAVANIVVLGVGLVTAYLHHRSVAADVDALFAALAPDPDAMPFDAMTNFRVLAFGDAIRAAVYGYFAWRISQPDVRAELV